MMTEEQALAALSRNEHRHDAMISLAWQAARRVVEADTGVEGLLAEADRLRQVIRDAMVNGGRMKADDHERLRELTECELDRGARPGDPPLRGELGRALSGAYQKVKDREAWFSDDLEFVERLSVVKEHCE